MTFLEDAKAGSVARKQHCSFQTLDLSKADAADLSEALKDLAVTHISISMALRARGKEVSPTTVGRHRKGQCSCGPR